jgi:uncharacterized protein (TIGR00369 family)
MSHAPFVLGPEQEAAIRHLFDQIPFNLFVGISLTHVSLEQVQMQMPMKPELIGNRFQGILHGGAIATLLDVAGGAMALIGVFERHHHLPSSERMARLAKLGTIDLRVDYLRPGRGSLFTAQASLLRSGNKVAVVRSELHNEEGVRVAVGTGTYLCG